MQIIFNNKSALYHFDIVAKLEVGIELEGWEVKSIKQQRANYKGAYVVAKDSQLWLTGAHIPAYRGGFVQPEMKQHRQRRLLAKKSEIARFTGYASRSGYTILPLQVYVNDSGLIKLAIALVKGKKKHDKRKRVKEREQQREMRREHKHRI